MRLTKVVAILALLTLSLPAYAGPGVHVGGNLGNISLDPSADTESRLGFIVGAHYSLGLGIISLEPGIQYAQRRYGMSFAGESASVTAGYLEVPVMAKLKMPGLPFLVAGPNLGMKLGVSCSSSVGTCTIESDSVKSTNFGAEFGVGMDIALLTVEARYYLGLANVSETAGVTAKPTGFQLLLSLGL